MGSIPRPSLVRSTSVSSSSCLVISCVFVDVDLCVWVLIVVAGRAETLDAIRMFFGATTAEVRCLSVVLSVMPFT